MVHMLAFGPHIRVRRISLARADRRYSLRQVSRRLGVQASFLSKVERGAVPPPSERSIVALARELDEDPDVLLAMAGRVSSELQTVIRDRPTLFARLIRELKEAPDEAVRGITREVRDGIW